MDGADHLLEREGTTAVDLRITTPSIAMAGTVIRESLGAIDLGLD